MINNFGTVVDKDNNKICFVAIDNNKNPLDYTLKESEKVILESWDIANTMVKPKWNGAEWIETATEEEIKSYKDSCILPWNIQVSQ